MEFRVLGPLRVFDGGASIPVKGRIGVRLLAVLLTSADHGVSMERLIEGIWDGRPPETARRQVRHAASRLRKALGEGRIGAAGDGYRLNTVGAVVDAREFEQAAREAQELAKAADSRRALDVLRSGLDLWTGEAYGGLTGRIIEAEVVRLNELNLTATEDRIELELHCGKLSEVIGELRRLVSDNPYRQRLASLLMLALHQDGRTPEALEAYETLRSRLADDLGLDPEPALRQRHVAILRADPSLDPSTGEAAPGAAVHAPPDLLIPAQLPAGPVSFTGRHAELRALDQRLGAGQARSCVIAGAAGAGKTALAVRWAHQVRDRFRDGQLFINLRGFDDGEPVSVADALGRFVRALQGANMPVPSDVDEAVALYRSLVDKRRLLVVLDNARDARQVRPLLPPGESCLALVTSRHKLAGLTARDGADTVALGVFDRSESIALLKRILGADRASDEPVAVDRLADLCDDLPLALRIAAAHLAVHPRQAIADYVAELSAGDRLSVLATDGDPDATVVTALDYSFRALDSDTRRLFCLLGLIPGEDFSRDLAAAVHNASDVGAERLLDRLETAHLVEQHQPSRYRFHDLVKEYAVRCASTALIDGDRQAAADRFVEWHYGFRFESRPEEEANVLAACQALRDHPKLWRLTATLTHAGNGGRLHDGLKEAIDAGMASAKTHGDPAGEWRMTNVLATYHLAVDDIEAAIESTRKGVDIAERVDTETLAAAKAGLGVTLFAAGNYIEAESHLCQSLAITPETADWRQLFHRRRNLANTYSWLGRYAEAREIHSQLYAQLQGKDSPLFAARLAYDVARRDLVSGKYDSALTKINEAVSTTVRIAEWSLEALARIIRGQLYRRLGDIEDAKADLLRALDLARQAQRRGTECTALSELAVLYSNAGDHHRAVEYADMLAADRFKASSPHIAADNALALSIVHTGIGDCRTAARHASRAVELNEHGPRPLELARSHLALADAHAGLGDHDAAKKSRKRALDLFAELGVSEGH